METTGESQHEKIPANIEELTEYFRNFVKEREWEEFHGPKNLLMALTSEVGELCDLFRWLTPQESLEIIQTGKFEQVKDELADVFLFVVRLADVLGIDLLQVAWNKMQKNAIKYPVHLSRKAAIKYNELERDSSR